MADEESRKRSKYKKSHYNKKRRVDIKNLTVGMNGVLITCNDKRERNAVREAYNILNEYADKMYGKEMTNDDCSSSEEEDIEKAIAKEKQEMKNDFQRFHSVKCAAKNVLFIKTVLPNDEHPLELVHTILSDIFETGSEKSRNCMRFLPVSVCCYANMKEIELAAEKLFKDSFLAPDAKPCKFSVVYKARNNNSVKRDDVIACLAAVVMQSGNDHSVDLNHPELTICVEIIRTICCLSVVKDFHKLKKYNIQEIQNRGKQNDSSPVENKEIEKNCNSSVPQEAEDDESVSKEGEAVRNDCNSNNNTADNDSKDTPGRRDDDCDSKEQETTADNGCKDTPGRRDDDCDSKEQETTADNDCKDTPGDSKEQETTADNSCKDTPGRRDDDCDSKEQERTADNSRKDTPGRRDDDCDAKEQETTADNGCKDTPGRRDDDCDTADNDCKDTPGRRDGDCYCKEQETTGDNESNYSQTKQEQVGATQVNKCDPTES